jgi:hypothetical protein
MLEASMASYKHIDTSPRFLAVDLQKQLMPGCFEYALNYLVDHEIDLSGFNKQYRQTPRALMPTRPPCSLKWFYLPMRKAWSVAARWRVLVWSKSRLSPCVKFWSHIQKNVELTFRSPTERYQQSEDIKPNTIKVEPILIDTNVAFFQHSVNDFNTWLAQIMPTKEIKLANVAII